MVELPEGSKIKVREPAAVEIPVDAQPINATPAEPMTSGAIVDGFWTGNITNGDMESLSQAVSQQIGNAVMNAAAEGKSIPAADVNAAIITSAVVSTAILVFARYAKDAINTLQVVIDAHEHPTTDNVNEAQAAVFGYIERNRS
jgi:hypothetical protein